MNYDELTADPHLQKIIAIVTSPYYKQQADDLIYFLINTRMESLYWNPEQLLVIQDGFVEKINNLRTVNQEGVRLVRAIRSGNNLTEAREHEFQLARNRYIMRATQMIADGLAFRMLGFDRPLLRMTVAPTKYDASVDFSKSYEGMVDAAKRLMEQNGSCILFNDLTNVLRLGDLTEVFPDGRVMFHELKQNGKRIINASTVAEKLKRDPNAEVSKQAERMIKAQIARDQGHIYADDGYVQICDVRVPFKNYLDQVCRTIRVAREKGRTETTIGDFLHIKCTSLEFIQNEQDFVSLPHFHPPNWDDADVCIDTSNYDLCFTEDNEYAKNMTPYSVFPFSNRDCLDLMTGRLILSSKVNLSAIARLFVQRGWEAKLVADQVIIDRMDAYTNALDSGRRTLISGHTVPALIVRRRPFNLEVSLVSVSRVGRDFMCPTMLVAEAEYLAEATPYGDVTMRDVFLSGEQDVWF